MGGGGEYILLFYRHECIVRDEVEENQTSRQCMNKTHGHAKIVRKQMKQKRQVKKKWENE